MTRLRLAIAMSTLSPALLCQQDPPQQQPTERPPIVVTASRTSEDPFLSPYSINAIDAELMRTRSYRTTPQALRDQPGVLVQETSPGQGSPFIRGFTGYLDLFLIDGVRLNNSVFRSGPNQYWNTVDPLSLDRLEVLRGPAGAQYGSDAVGGTVQAFTRDPYRYSDKGLDHGGSTFVRYATAENSIQGRGEISVGQTWEDGSRTGFLIGADAKSFGDVEGGHDTGPQPKTGYSETAVDAKVEHWFDKDTRLVLLRQDVSQESVPRTHATLFAKSFRGSAVGTDRQRDLFQDRSLTYLQLHKTGLEGAVQGVRASVSWQQQQEDEDRIRANGTQDWQGFEVDTMGTFLQFDSDAGAMGRLTWGFDYYRDKVDSYRRSTVPLPTDPIQGPVADNAAYDLLGVFVQDRIELTGFGELTLGARYTWAHATANEVLNPPTGTQTSIDDQWDQFTGNARLRVDLVEKRWNLFTGVSQGFRAPNLSDMSSFGIARGGEVEVPATGLEPEHYLSYEVGTKVRSDSVTAQAAWFYTAIEDQILRFPTGTIDPGSGLPIVTKGNVGEGYVQGVELEGGWLMGCDTTLFGTFTWQYGRVTNFDTAGGTLSEEYVSRLMPLTVMTGLRWQPERTRFYAETLVIYADDADKLSSGDQRDTQRIPPGGTPSYTLWNAHCGFCMTDRATLDVGIDNITDVDYRVHGSGTNSPGRNLWIGMRVKF